MADPITIGLTAVGAGASLFGSSKAAQANKLKGQAEYISAEFEKKQHEINQQQLRTAAAQDEAKRRDGFVSSLETIMALRSGRGLGTTSPTAMAVLDEMRRRNETDIITSKANLLTKSALSGEAAAIAGMKGKTSLLAGDLAADATLASGAYTAASLGTGLLKGLK